MAGPKTWREKREENLTFWDHVQSSVKPMEDRDKFLQERADANKARKDAEESARRAAEKQGRKNRRSLP